MAQRRFFKMPAIDQPDPEPGYQHNSDEFAIPTTDEDGNTERCQFRAPAQLAAWAGDIVHSGKFPFRREGDLYRYGLYLACTQLSRIELEVPSLTSRIDASFAILRRKASAAQVIEHLERVQEIVLDLQKKKAWGEISWCLAAEFRAAEATIAIEPYWGQRWLDGLKDRFSDIQQYAESKLGILDLRPRITPETPKQGKEESEG